MGIGKGGWRREWRLRVGERIERSEGENEGDEGRGRGD
jgi:hypothetical protein